MLSECPSTCGLSMGPRRVPHIRIGVTNRYGRRILMASGYHMGMIERLITRIRGEIAN